MERRLLSLWRKKDLKKFGVFADRSPDLKDLKAGKMVAPHIVMALETVNGVIVPRRVTTGVARQTSQPSGRRPGKLISSGRKLLPQRIEKPTITNPGAVISTGSGLPDRERIAEIDRQQLRLKPRKMLLCKGKLEPNSNAIRRANKIIKKDILALIVAGMESRTGSRVSILSLQVRRRRNLPLQSIRICLLLRSAN